MPTLPTFESRRNIQAQSNAPLRNEAAQAIAPSQKIISALGDITQRLAKANDVMQATDAKANYEMAVTDIENRAIQDPDFNSSDKYRQELDKAKERSLNTVENQEIAGLMALDFNKNNQIANIKINNVLWKKKQAHGRLQLENGVFSIQKKVLESPTENTASNYKREIDALLQANVNAGIVTEEEAGKIRIKSNLDLVENDILANPLLARERLYNRAYEIPESDRLNLLSKARTELNRKSKQNLDDLYEKYIEGTLTLEDVESVSYDQEDGGIGAVASRRVMKDLDRYQSDILQPIYEDNKNAEKYIDLVNSVLSSPKDKYKAKQIIANAYSDGTLDQEEAKKLKTISKQLEGVKFTRDHPVMNQVPILNSWFGTNEEKKTDLAVSLSNYLGQVAEGKDPNTARDNVLREQYNKTYPQNPLTEGEDPTAPKKPKDVYYTPFAEKMWKGFGMGVAGVVEGVGGAAKAFGGMEQKLVGEILTAYADDMKKEFTVPDPDFSYKLAGGVASAGTFFIPGVGIARGVQAMTLFPRLGMWLGVSASTALESVVEAGSTYERAIDKGMSEKLAKQAATRTFWTNVPTIALTNRLGGLFGVEQGSALVKALKSGTMEGLQEGTQSMIGNFFVNDPVMQGAMESAVIGAIVGGGIGLTQSASQTITDLKDTNKTIAENIKSKIPPVGLSVKDVSGTDFGMKEDVTKVEPTAQESSDPLIEEAKKFKTADEFVESNIGKNLEGSMQHRPTFTRATADNVTQEVSEMGLPEDFYDNPKLYATGDNKSDTESIKALLSVKGNPDAEVIIYRASPKKELRIGDWVTLSKNYAEGESIAEEVEVHSFKVKAKDIHFAGDSINEFGYYPADEVKKLTSIWEQANKQDKTNLSNERGSMTLPSVDPALKKAINKYTDASIVPLSTRLARIDERLRDVVRKFEYSKLVSIKKDLDFVHPFMKKAEGISQEDFTKLDLALKNGETEVVDEIVAKNGLTEDYKAVRETLQDIYNRAHGVGIEMGYIDNYFPRRVADPEAFIAYLQKKAEWSQIDKSIRAEEKKVGRRLDNDERAEFINKLLRGYGDQQIRIARPSNVKERKIDVIDEEMNAFYVNSNVALQDYVLAMNSAIEAKKFFGLNSKEQEGTIGDYVRELVDTGMINSSQEQEVMQIMKAMFHGKQLNSVWSFYKNLGYIYTMGSPISAITQIGDLAFSLYENGFYSTVEGVKSALSKDKITKEDLGINSIAHEFSNATKTSEMVRNVFKVVGLEGMDSFGKETMINSTFDSIQKKANKGDSKLRAEIDRVFEDEASQVWEDIKAGNPTENVKYILFSRLLKYQPLTISEMPEYYSTGTEGPLPGRVMYMLKSYTIKQLDVYHNEVLRQFNSDPKQAMKNLVSLSLALALTGAATDTIKDIILGRPITLSDLAVDNMLKLMGFNKYVIYQAKREGLASAFRHTILPPIPFVDDLYRDLTAKDKELGNFKVWNAVPFVGKMYYWWFGGGADYKNRKKGKSNSISSGF